MNIETNEKIVEEYFYFMKNWNNDQKKNIIIKLMSSIDVMTVKSKNITPLFGSWHDSRSAEEIIDEVTRDRINKDSIEEF